MVLVLMGGEIHQQVLTLAEPFTQEQLVLQREPDQFHVLGVGYIFHQEIGCITAISSRKTFSSSCCRSFTTHHLH